MNFYIFILFFLSYTVLDIPQSNANAVHPEYAITQVIRPRSPLGKNYFGKSKGPFILLYISEPIGIEEVAIYESMLMLSEEQIIAADDLYDQYLIKEDVLRTKFLIPLWELSATMAGGQHRRDPDGDTKIRNLRDSCQRMLEHLKNHDDEFFEALQPILDDSQKPTLDKVIQQRTRFRARASARFEIPGSDVDLARILTNLLWKIGEEFPRDEDPLSVYMTMYEESATALFREYAQQEQRAGFDSALNDYIFTQAKAKADPDESEESRTNRIRKHMETRRVLKQTPVSLAINLYKLNAKYTDICASELDEPLRSQFLQAVHRETCAAIYDDPYDLTAMLEDISAEESLTDDKREALSVTTESYLVNRNLIERSMMKRFVEYKKRWMETYSGGQNAEQTLVERIGVLDRRRLKNAITTLEQVRELLTAEQREAVSNVLKAAEEQMKQPIVPFNKRVYL